MSDLTRQVLQKHFLELSRDLDLTADLNGHLIHYGLFNEDMMDEIMSERTRKARVQKLLKMLPRRGPRAFDKFVRAIQNDYSWIAEKLRRTHHMLTSHKDDQETLTLKAKVDIYVHEQFGLSKRFSEDDKKEIRNFLYRNLLHRNLSEIDDDHHAPNHATKTASQDVTDSGSPPSSKPVNANQLDVPVLAKVYRMLSQTDNGASGEPCPPPESVSIEMIEDQVNVITGRMSKLQNEVNECFTVLGIDNPDRPLSEVLKESSKELAQLRGMTEHLNKLEAQRQELEETLANTQQELEHRMNELADMAHENERSQAQMKDLREKCEKLETIQTQQLLKQNTLVALHNIAKELNPLRNSMVNTSLLENSEPLPSVEKHHHLRKSKSHKLPKLPQVQLGYKTGNHHYTDPTVASREHSLYPQRTVRESFGGQLQITRR